MKTRSQGETKMVTLRELCARRKIDPRAARRRLRNAGKDVPQPKGHRWEWTPTQAKDVVKYITD